MTTDKLVVHKQAAIRVTLIGSVLDLALGVMKILVGLVAGSFALVSDGVHSLSDLVTDAFVLAIARVSHEAPDAEHPYGHRRFETLGTIVIGIGLFIIAGVICYDSLRRMSAETLRVPGTAALGVAVFSILGKEWIYRYTRRVAERIGSSMLLANAWHSRTDALTSIAVLLGLIGAQAGYPWMDLVAALAVGLMIARIAWQLMRGSLQELVDTGLPRDELDYIRDHILSMAGIHGVHELRSRRHGGQTFLDIHVQVDSNISVSEGHYLGDRIIGSLKTAFPEIADVVIHIDPELDLDEQPRSGLPLRREVLQALMTSWDGLLTREDIDKLTLHYLHDKVQVEVVLKGRINIELKEKLEKVLEEYEWLESLRFYQAIQ